MRLANNTWLGLLTAMVVPEFSRLVAISVLMGSPNGAPAYLMVICFTGRFELATDADLTQLATDAAERMGIARGFAVSGSAAVSMWHCPSKKAPGSMTKHGV